MGNRKTAGRNGLAFFTDFGAQRLPFNSVGWMLATTSLKSLVGVKIGGRLTSLGSSANFPCARLNKLTVRIGPEKRIIKGRPLE
jgi:hypothetical protein